MNSNTVVFFHGLVLLNLDYRQKNRRKKIKTQQMYSRQSK